MMYYYEVLPKDQSFFSEKLLTYSHPQDIEKNSIVKISLKSKIVLGIVIKKTTKPKFRTNLILNLYSDIGPIPDGSIKLLNWIHSYYPGPPGLVLNMFLPSQILNSNEKTIVSHTTNTNNFDIYPIKLPKLTDDQSNALKKIASSGSYLLHGDTGTGKTRVYIELAKKCIENRSSALILTPEINLTPQLAAEFQKIFGDKVLINHSKISPKERYKIWTKVLFDNDGLVLLGPRSSLFMPFNRLGLVVVDESHESSYKQEQSPHYHANRVASRLASIHNAIFIMGSATPSITDYFLAKQKNVPIIRMKNTAVNSNNGPIKKEIIDIKDKAMFTKSMLLSDRLIGCIETALKDGEQCLLYLNRRGTSRIILCENCGWQSLCPNCDTPLVYHGDDHEAKCHICGYKERPSSNCPECLSSKIIFKGYGTKTLMTEVNKLFPEANIRRFDTDNSKKDSLEQNYYSVKSGETDIIVGTQTLIKGLDLPKLSVVGVVVAESSLSFPDYTATETTYQQINQVLGRIGRGHRKGIAIIQAYNPKNKAILDATKLDFEDFYNSEIKERDAYKYPPFSQILKLTCLKSSKKVAENFSNKLVDEIKNSKVNVEISGPVPSFYAKVDKKFQYQLIIRAKLRSELIKVIKILPSGWNYDIDPINLL